MSCENHGLYLKVRLFLEEKEKASLFLKSSLHFTYELSTTFPFACLLA